MNYIRKLLLKYLKKNPFRSALSILGISISVALMVILFDGLLSMNSSFRISDVNLYGFHDFSVENANEADFNSLNTSRYIDKLSKVSNDRASLYIKEVNTNRYNIEYFQINNVNEDYLKDIFKYKLVEGRINYNEGEALLPYSLKPFAKYHMKDGFLNLDTYRKNLISPLVEELVYGGNEQEESISNLQNLNKLEKEQVKLKVVGYYMKESDSYFLQKDSNDLKINVFEGDILVNKKDIYQNFTLFGTFKHFEEIVDPYEFIDSTLYSNEPTKLIAINDPILINKYPRVNDNYNFYIFIGSIFLIIIVMAFFLFISSIFSTNYYEKIREFALLRTVGMTRKQFKRLLFYESLMYFFISFPIGLLIGKIASRALFSYVIQVVSTSVAGLVFDMTYKNSTYEYIFIALLTFLLVLHAQMTSSRKVFRKDLKADNGLFNYIMLKIRPSKRQKNYNFIKKLLGYEGLLAFKNTKRNKNKFIFSTISISLCIVLFISIGFLTFFFGLPDFDWKNASKSYYGNFYINDSFQTENVLNDLNSIDKINAKFEKSKIDGIEILNANNESLGINNSIYFIDDNILKNILGKDLENNELVSLYKRDSKLSDIKFQNNGPSVKVLNIDADFTGLNLIEVSDRVLIGPLSQKEFYRDKLFDKEYKGEIYDIVEVTSTDKSLVSQNDLRALIYKYPEIFEEGYQIPVIKIIRVFIFGFIAVVTGISVLNVANSTYNIMITRKGEFALLKAVGVDDKKLYKIIFYEASFSILLSSLITFFISLFFSYYLKILAINVADYSYIYLRPIEYWFFASIISLTLVYSFSILPVMKMKKMNLMDQLKKFS